MKIKWKKFVNVLYIFVLAVLSILLYSNTTYISILGGDTGDAAYGVMAGLAQIINNGELPLWNPYMWGGMTAVGNSVSQAFYPITWLLCKICFNEETGMLSYTAIHYSHIFHVFVLAFGCYVLFRVMKMMPIVAFSAASLTTFCGSAFQMMGWLYIYSGLVYIPLFLALFILMCRDMGRKGLRYCGLAGIVFGLSGLSASSHGILFLILSFAVVYFVYMYSVRKRRTDMIKITVRCFAIGLIGIGIMSISLFPLVEFLDDAYRYIPGIDGIMGSQKIPFASFIEHSLNITDLRRIVGGYSGWLAIGTVLPLLVFVGLFSKVKENKEQYWSGISLLLIGLLYSCAIFLPYVMYFVPFYNSIREPYLYSFLFSIGAGIVGAIGLNALVIKGTDYSQRFYNFTGLCIVIVATAIYAFFVQNWAIPTFVAVISFFLILAVKKVRNEKNYFILIGVILILITASEYCTFRDAVEKQGNYSIQEADQIIADANENILQLLGEVDLPSDNDAYRIVQWTSQEQAYPSNVWSVWGYNDAAGYMNPMYNKAMNMHINWSLEKHMQMSNIRYMVCTDKETEEYKAWVESLGLKEIRRVENIQGTYDSENLVEDIVYENENRKGNAWFVKDWIGYTRDSDIGELNDIVNSEDFDPFFTALVNEDTCENTMKMTYADPRDCSIVMTDYNANSVMFEVSVPEEAFMVTAEIIAPGWEAYIDGKKADIIEVNTAFRGVIVPEGEHNVEYRYLPKTVIIGGVLGIVSICSAVALILLSMKEKSNPPAMLGRIV